MTTLTATATCTAWWGTCETTGERLHPRLVAQRVGWLSDLVQQMTEQVVASHWTSDDLATLAAGVGADGRKLPSSGWMALRRLGWGCQAPAGVYVRDRVRRIAQEHAARLLRLAVYRDGIVRAVAGTWPVDPKRRTSAEWDLLRSALPKAVPNAVIRNRTRQVTTHLTDHGTLPAGVCEAEDPPTVDGQILLGAADCELVTVAHDPAEPGTVLLRLRLPTVAAPTSGRGWGWVVLPVRLPAYVPVNADVRTPTLRLVDGRVRVDLPWVRPVSKPVLVGHRRAVGVDWGYNTLLTATAGRLRTDRRGRARVVTAGKPVAFAAPGVQAKLDRLRTAREQLAAKREHYRLLLAGRPDPALQAIHDRADVEHGHVCARSRALNDALAWAAARWTVDHAVAAGATAIYIEDLTELESVGMSKRERRRQSGHVRGMVYDYLQHLAAAVGIAVATVPARGTSAGCPGCPGPVRHVKAPDRAARGHKWSTCRNCGLSCDRDHAAAERILARGLLGQDLTRRTRAGTLHIRATTDGPVRRIPKPRDKTGPTPSRPAHHHASSPTPKRRRVPATRTKPPHPGVGAVRVKRPAGRTPQTCSTTVGQVPTASPTRHHPQGWRLGRGFHLHVQASALPHARPQP